MEHNAEALLEKLAEADFVVHPDRPADLLKKTFQNPLTVLLLYGLK